MASIRTSIIAVFILLVLSISNAFSEPELRGVWITSWEDGFFTPEQIDKTIAISKRAGMNALFIEVRKFADAYYDSKIEPRGPEVPAGFDPLAYTIKKAHPEGIQVYAWVVVYRAWCGQDNKPPTDPNHIINKHPDWVLIDRNGKNWAGEGMYLDPGVPAAREYIVSVFEDIARRYNVDGIQYDYVRYPGGDWGYSETALKHYYADTGATTKPAPNDLKWADWRRKQVDIFVKLAHDRIKSAAPNCKITASTICYGGCPDEWTKTTPYLETYQDWNKWLKNGWLDSNIPMNYKRENPESEAKLFRNWNEASKRWGAGKPVYMGIGSGGKPVEDVIKQIDAVRKAGLQGFVLFAFNDKLDRDERSLALGKALGPAPKLKVNMVNGINSLASHKQFDAGVKLAMSGKLPQARAKFKKATELDPGYAEAFFRIGRCYLREKNQVKAREFFSRALQVDDSHEGARKELELIK